MFVRTWIFPFSILLMSASCFGRDEIVRMNGKVALTCPRIDVNGTASVDYPSVKMAFVGADGNVTEIVVVGPDPADRKNRTNCDGVAAAHKARCDRVAGDLKEKTRNNDTVEFEFMVQYDDGGSKLFCYPNDTQPAYSVYITTVNEATLKINLPDEDLWKGLNFTWKDGEKLPGNCTVDTKGRAEPPLTIRFGEPEKWVTWNTEKIPNGVRPIITETPEEYCDKIVSCVLGLFDSTWAEKTKTPVTCAGVLDVANTLLVLASVVFGIIATMV